MSSSIPPIHRSHSISIDFPETRSVDNDEEFIEHSQSTIPLFSEPNRGVRTHILHQLSTRPVADIPLSATALIAVLKNFPEQQCLDLSGLNPLSDEQVMEILSICQELNQLYLADCVTLSLKGIKNALPSLKNLRTLDLSGTVCSDKTLRELEQNCPHLETLSLRNCAVTAKAIGRLLKSRPNIVDLDLRHCQYLGPRLLATLEKYGSKLKQLSLQGTMTDLDQGLSILHSLPQLNRLHFGANGAIHHWTHIEDCPTSEEVDSSTAYPYPRRRPCSVDFPSSSTLRVSLYLQ